MEQQHRLGQHYSKEKELIQNYNEILLKKKNKIIIDPFVGEGHLLFYYLNLFDKEQQLKLLLEGKIRGYDLYEKNIIYVKNKMKELYNLEDKLLNELFKVKDSFLENNLEDIKEKKEIFILTNPPYLAKNICKKKYPNDFNKYFIKIYKKENDYFEIALKKYNNYEGIWIVPANIFSSDIMHNIRQEIIFNLENIYIYKKKIFQDTDINVSTFYNNIYRKTQDKNIYFVDNETKEQKLFNITKNGNLSREWEEIKRIKNINKIKQGYIDTKIKQGAEEVKLINTKYNVETYHISNEQKKLLLSNILILRTTDTGSENGKLGLYTIEELWGEKEAIGLVTKISSRVYTQLFVNLSISKQLKLKNEFNLEIKRLRDKYNSIFLTNYKNSSNGEQRKRISFKEAFSLMNKIINTKL